jgi:hypothetical protein
MKRRWVFALIIISALLPNQVFATSASVTGTVTYSGVHTGSVYVGAFNAPCGLNTTPVRENGPLTLVGNSVAYTIDGLDFNNARYWICANLDANGIGGSSPDGGDPFGQYSNNPLTIATPTTISDIDFNITDTPLPSTYLVNPPVINGSFGDSEWPANYVLKLRQGLDSTLFVMNDRDNIYMMVDAASLPNMIDVTDDIQDHCTVYLYKNSNGLWKGIRVTVFGDGILFCESTNDTSSLTWTSMTCPAGVEAADGFGPSPDTPSPSHRMYEFKIPLNTIGAGPGDLIYFASPRDIINSLPFDYNGDGTDQRYNLWPENSDVSDPATWGQILLGGGSGIPTLTEWGMIIFTILAGLGAVYYLRRQKRAKS